MISYALEAVVEYLRSEYSWTAKEISVQFRGYPPPTAGQWFVGVDEGGVDQTARQADSWMKELVTIEVVCWRRAGEVPRDYIGNVVLSQDRYRTLAESLHSMERQVVIALHKQYGPLAAFNAKLPEDSNDASIPLSYLGRPAHEDFSPPDTTRGGEMFFIGRRLRFKGFDRTQSLTCLT